MAVHAEILTIGREILDGRVVDTNSVFLAETLLRRGIVPRHAQRVDDDLARIVDAFRLAESRSDLVLVTGGLGPTSDDITAEAFARFLGEELALNEEALAQLNERLALLNRPLTETQAKQARLPKSCFVVRNSDGTAPGFGFEKTRTDGRLQQWFFMPGVPREMKKMMDEEIQPRLPRVDGYRTYSWATHFTAEATLQERLAPIEKTLPPGFEVTYRTRAPENHVGLHGECATPERLALFDALIGQIGRVLGPDAFASGPGLLPSLEQVVVTALEGFRKAGYAGAILCTIESCTGGLIANRVTDIAGSSQVFWMSEIVYDNSAKHALGVPPHLIEKYGAVSPEVARALADRGLEELVRLTQAGARKDAALFCLATTGIAGPSGGSPEKPVGICHVALSSNLAPTVTEEVRARAALGRMAIKLHFSQKALDLLRLRLLEITSHAIA